MQFKFKHTKINFVEKPKSSGGFNIQFDFGEQLKSSYLELSQLDKKYVTVDLSKAGAILTHANNVFVSFGNKEKFNANSVVSAVAATLARFISGNKIDEVTIHLNDQLLEDNKLATTEFVEQLLVEMINGLYYFDDFKSEKNSLKLGKINFKSKTDLGKSITNAIAILEGLFIVRDLGNNPPNVATPTYLAKTAKDFEKINKNVSAEILTEKEIKELEMNAFLGVAKGSKEEPRFIKLEYKGGKKNAKPIVLVGKGITFDSGGISLKPGANMDDMKFDMCGAATVLGVFAAVAGLGLEVNLITLVAACENMPSGKAQKPGDIVTSMSGKTIEILNTDAEGRLILCDALHYAKQFKPEFVVDVATLTGACVIALGNVASGLYVNDEDLYVDIEAASLKANDKVWRMPLFDEYTKMIQGNHADLLNIGGWGGKGGSATAAAFLKEFIDYKWAHLDIAGVANSPEAKGATGRPFKLLVELIRSRIK
ncbi:leucyl aminopeptidase [Aquella oligotrophica]|uniref:Probable cytosol aminopeptidase n=1 Tax=Aquella oligotrophica TaxID=2067065 RepID=A0A2I7N5U2_9NEIS|nr:leucyl aminopeptidase [Aquella oligotrophica]AUR51836.1 leucyl aminopeptidase [Aquella oligotrophica]